MKFLLISVMVLAAIAAKTEHSYTQGVVVQNANLNYKGDGTLSAFISYTTDNLMDHTVWTDETTKGKFDKTYESWYEDEND